MSVDPLSKIFTSHICYVFVTTNVLNYGCGQVTVAMVLSLLLCKIVAKCSRDAVEETLKTLRLRNNYGHTF